MYNQKRLIRHLAVSLSTVFFVIALLSVKIYAAPGALDPTFSGDGKLKGDFVPGMGGSSYAATAIQPDGKIVSVGGIANYPRYLYAARYNTDGSPDSTFGVAGLVQFQFGGFYNYIGDVAIQPDGKILIAGCYCEEDIGGYTMALTRLNSNGSLDHSFGDVGIVLRPDLAGPANSIAVQPDGKIVVAGQAGFYGYWVVLRLHPDGRQDQSFFYHPNVLSRLGAPFSVAVQADGRVLVAGNASNGSPGGEPIIVRYNADGSLDTSFDGDGIVTTPLGSTYSSIAVQSDGRIVAAGSTIARYLPNGTLDAAFDGDGIVSRSTNSIAIQPDGKIVGVGSVHNGADDDFAIFRLDQNGYLDATFGGGDGVSSADFDASNDYPFDVAIDNAGRAVVVGASNGGFALARFLLLQLPISVSGRVTSPTGTPLRNSVVTLTSSTGETRIAVTSSFGLYVFEDVVLGGPYILGVRSKRYRFAPRTIQVEGNISGVDLVGLE